MQLISPEIQKVFVDSLKNIYEELDDIIDKFGGIENYKCNNMKPYNIDVSLQDIIDVVDSEYIALAENVVKIYNNTIELKHVREDIVHFYNRLKYIDSIDYTGNNEVQTEIIALVLMFVYNSCKSSVNIKVYNILRSMCLFPTVGTLVQVTSSVTAV